MVQHDLHIQRIRVPTPFPVGPVNCYLIEGNLLTLVDCGPHSERSEAVMNQELARFGYALGDIKQILLTHGHIDHTGMCRRIYDEVQKSSKDDCQVWLHEHDLFRLTNHEEYIAERAQTYIRVAKMSGVPESILDRMSVEKIRGYFQSLGQSLLEARGFRDGRVFDSGIGPIKAVWTPGHSMGSTCFVCENQNIVFSGDHLLSDISSNSSLDFNASSEIGLLRYLKSLEVLLDLGEYRALPGHRDEISDIGLRIEELQTEIDTKLTALSLTLTNEPTSIYTLSRNLFGEYAVDELFLALAETFDLLRVLADRGIAQVSESHDQYYGCLGIHSA